MADFYVDAVNGNNNNSGTIGSPWQTFAKWSTAVAGSGIIFRAPGSTYSTRVQYAGGGVLTGKNFTLKNYPDEHVELRDITLAQAFVFRDWTGGAIIRQGSGTITIGPCAPPANVTQTDWNNCALLLSGVKNLLIDGGTNIASCGIVVRSSSDRGIYIEKNGSHSSATGGSQNIEIRGVEFTDNACGMIALNPQNNNRLVATDPVGPGINVHHCWFHHNQRMGVKAGVGGDTGGMGAAYTGAYGTALNPMLLHDNLFHDNVAYDMNPGDYGQDGGAWETFGCGYLYAYNNIAWNNAGGSESGTAQPYPLSSNLHFHHNVIYGLTNNIPGPGGTTSTIGNPPLLWRDASDSTFDHNVVDVGPNALNVPLVEIYKDTGTYGGNIDRIKVRNNILINRNVQGCYYLKGVPGGADAPVIDYNIVIVNRPIGVAVGDIDELSPKYRTWTQWQAAGYDTHGQNIDYAAANALFLDRPNRDYRLSAASLAKDAGIVIAGFNDGYVPPAPDIGAYEYGSTPPPVSTVVVDTFSRSTAGGSLGTADTGGAYTLAATGGATSEMLADGVQEVTQVTAIGSHWAHLLAASIRDVDYTIVRAISALPPSGETLDLGHWARLIDDSPLAGYLGRISIDSAGAVTLMLDSYVAGASTGGVSAASAVVIVPGTRYNVRLQAVGATPTALTLKVWRVSDPEPAAWGLSWSNSSATLQVAGAASFGTTSSYSPAPTGTALYGTAFGMDGLQYVVVGGPPGVTTRQLSYRYRAGQTSTLSGVRIAFPIIVGGGASWDAAGNGGTYELSIQTDDGTASHFPTGTKIGTASFGARGLYDTQGNWPVVSTNPIPQTAGTLYHVVIRSTDPDPVNNFASFDQHWFANIPNPRQPRYPNTDWAVLIKDSGAWADATFNGGTEAVSPLIEIRYTNGVREGIGYIYRDYTTTPTDIGGGAIALALDDFNRTAVSPTWGTAQTGGAWSGGGSGTDATTGTKAIHTYSAASTGRREILAVNTRDVDVKFKVALDKVPVGGSFWVYLEGRWQSTTVSYRGKIRFATSGAVYFHASRSNSGEVDLGAEVQIASFTYVANAYVWLRAQFESAASTTIRVKAWPDGTSEPGTWGFTVADNVNQSGAGSLGVAGSVGLSTFQAATNQPIVMSVDDFSAYTIGSSALRVRQTFTPTADRTVVSASVRAYLVSGSGALTVAVKNAVSGVALATGTISAATFTLSGAELAKWGTFTFPGPITLLQTTAYYLELTAPAGTTYRTFAPLQGGPPSDGWDPLTYFTDGQAEKDTGTGSYVAWETGQTNHDLQFYFTPAVATVYTYADDWNVDEPFVFMTATDAGTSGEAAALTASIRLAAVSAGVSSDTAALNTGLTLTATDDGVSGGFAQLNAGALTSLQASDLSQSGDTATLLPTAAGYSQTPGIPIEVTVFSSFLPPPDGPMLAVLEGAREARWYDPLNDIGNGSFQIATTDRKAIAENLATGNIVVFRLQGVPRYAIVIESADEIVASPSGKSGEYYEVKGRGLESILTNAVQAPTGNDYGTVPAAAVLTVAVAAASTPTRPVLPSTLTLSFDGSIDSVGALWGDSANYIINPGTNYLDILKLMSDIGIDWRMTPDMTLRAYRDGFGDDLTGQVVFRQGRHFRGNVRRVRQGLQITDVYVEGKSGTISTVLGTRPEGHIREAFVKVSATDEPSVLQQVGQQTIDASIAATNALPVQLLHGLKEGEYEPYIDYTVGDTVQVDVPGAIDMEEARVVALTIAATADGSYTVDADLNSIFLEELVRVKMSLDRAIADLGG